MSSSLQQSSSGIFFGKIEQFVIESRQLEEILKNVKNKFRKGVFFVLEGVSPQFLGLAVLILDLIVILAVFGLYKLIKYILIRFGIVTKEQWKTRNYDCFNDEDDD